MSESALELRARGTRSLLVGDARAAFDALAKSIALDALDPVAHHNYALAARLLGSLDEALIASSTAAQLAPTRAPVLAQHALHARLAGAHATAESLIDRALAADPTHRVSWYYRGLFARLDGDPTKAIYPLDRAIDRRVSLPSPPLPPLVRARIEGMLADIAGARASRRIGARSMIAAISEPILSDDTLATLDLDVSVEDAEPAVARENSVTNPTAITAADAAMLVHTSSRIAVLTGAGCSRASGLATRRELWQRFDKDASVTVTHYDSLTLWYAVGAMIGRRAFRPNDAHHVIAALPRTQFVVTQNVDGLHQRAARSDVEARAIIELHGSLERPAYCARCGKSAGRSAIEVARGVGDERAARCSACQRASLRPDVVLFGEWVDSEALERASSAVSACDLLIVVGCAMDVAPASELPRIAAARGTTVLEVNTEPTRLSRSLSTRWLKGPADQSLVALYEALCELEALPEIVPAVLSSVDEAVATARDEVIVTIPVPFLGEVNDEGSIAELPKAGRRVEADEPALLIDSDKATLDVSLGVAGEVVRSLVTVGQTVAVGQPMIELKTRHDLLAAARRDRVQQRWSSHASAVDRVHPLAQSFGAHTAAVRVLLEQLSTARWLQPDTQLAREEPAALDWVRDRVDEHRAALGLDELEIPVRLFRNALDAKREFHLAFVRRNDKKSPMARWFAALGALAANTEDTAIDSVWSATTTALDKSFARTSPWSEQSDLAIPESLVACATRAVRALAKRGPDAKTPCPYRPLLALWLRGAWPFVLHDAIGLWIPLREDGFIVPDPNAKTLAERREWPADHWPYHDPPGSGLRALWSAPGRSKKR